MCDTLYPLKLTKFAKELDDGKYAYSWYEDPQDGSTMEMRQWTATPAAPGSLHTSSRSSPPARR